MPGTLFNTFSDLFFADFIKPLKLRITDCAKYLGSAPTLGEIDISLSFKTTNKLVLGMSPALFKASNAWPAVIAPSPMMATWRLGLPCN